MGCVLGLCIGCGLCVGAVCWCWRWYCCYTLRVECRELVTGRGERRTYIIQFQLISKTLAGVGVWCIYACCVLGAACCARRIVRNVHCSLCGLSHAMCNMFGGCMLLLHLVPDPTRSYQILSHPTRSYQILPDPSISYYILPYPTRSY